MGEPIEFDASIVQVKTMADGGVRVSLDIPETNLPQAMALMAFRGVVVHTSIGPVEK